MSPKEEKIRIVESCYEKVKQEHGIYISYMANKSKALLVQDELPTKPIYDIISITMYLAGTFKVRAEYVEIMEKVHKEALLIPIRNPTATFVAQSMREKLPRIPIYRVSTISQILTGDYK